jgi:hypothetical protein
MSGEPRPYWEDIWRLLARGEVQGVEELSFLGDCRRELQRLIYDVERNRNRPEDLP